MRIPFVIDNQGGRLADVLNRLMSATWNLKPPQDLVARTIFRMAGLGVKGLRSVSDCSVPAIIAFRWIRGHIPGPLYIGLQNTVDAHPLGSTR